MNLAEFLSSHGKAIREAIARRFPPRVTQPVPLEHMKAPPLGDQPLAVAAAIEALKSRRAGIIVGEMGTGKTYMALATATHPELAARRVLVLCPPHLTEKWAREVRRFTDYRPVIVESVADLEALRKIGEPVVAILSREKAKLGPRFVNAVIPNRYGAYKALLQKARAEKPGPLSKRELRAIYEASMDSDLTLARCPHCGAPVTFKDGAEPLGYQKAKKSNAKVYCDARGNRAPKVCRTHSHLRAMTNQPRRWPLARYVAKRMRGFFDLVILDEAHEYKSLNSAQAHAAAQLAEHHRVLLLTGTLLGGYASTAWRILWHLTKVARADFSVDQLPEFVARYGAVRRITKHAGGEQGKRTYRDEPKTTTREAPAVSPYLLRYLLPIATFASLESIARDLPDYSEIPVLIKPDRAARLRIAQIEGAFGNLVANPRAQGAALAAGLFGVDAPHAHLTFFEENPELPTVEIGPLWGPGLDPEAPTLKERVLLHLVQKERAEGHRVLVYVNTTNPPYEVPKRLLRVLRKSGLRAEYLPAHAVSPKKREARIKERLEGGLEVLILHPATVQTGLDLLEFPTLIFFQPPTSVYLTRQASRRSWRIGQTQPVRVFYLAYQETWQEAMLQLLADKARASLAMEGTLVEGGISALTHEDPTLNLAQALTEKTVKLSPDRFAIGTLGLETQNGVLILSEESLEGIAELTPTPVPQTTITLPELPTLEELEAQGAPLPKRKRPPKNQPVLFAEALV